MNKIKCIVLLLGIFLPAAFGLANSGTTKEKDGGNAIVVIRKSDQNGQDRSGAISAYINNHVLNIAFTENLGNVFVEITNSCGAIMNFASLETPTGYQFFINIPGRYTVTFTLPNGDGYYGEFEVDE